MEQMRSETVPEGKCVQRRAARGGGFRRGSRCTEPPQGLHGECVCARGARPSCRIGSSRSRQGQGGAIGSTEGVRVHFEGRVGARAQKWSALGVRRRRRQRGGYGLVWLEANRAQGQKWRTEKKRA